MGFYTPAWILYVVGTFGLVAKAMSREVEDIDVSALIMGSVLLYGVLVPRFMDYSHLILVVPTLYVMVYALESLWARGIIIVALFFNPWPYHFLFLNILLLTLFIRHLKRRKAG